MNNIKYRAEIDGLRAIAVLPVILFHAGFEWFSGGFIGVDVFFVISGYLITTIIISSLEEDNFSILNFYERRARRILPALFFVMAVSIPFAWLWLTPSDLKIFGSSYLATSTFWSNILFWNESGYFDTRADLKPFLHTWSLAVEEQYYILFPIFLLLTWHFGMRLILVTLILIFCVSLGLAHWGSFNKPSATFFLLPTRVWELLIGVFIAFYLRHKTFLKSHVLNQALSLIGLIMVTYSIFVFDEHTPFPSFYALIPTLGTGLLIISAVPKTFVHHLLSLKFIVAIGLISYSAYLWHQPLLAFARHRLMGEVSDYLLIIICFASIAMAWFSWRFIEKPFRDKEKFNQKTIFTLSLSLIVIFSFLGSITYLKDGFYERFSPAVLAIDQMQANGTKARNYNCHLDEHSSKLTGCSFGRNGVIPKFALIGDSHAGAIHKSLANSMDRLGDSFILYAKNGCPPSLGLEVSVGKNCTQFMRNVIEDIHQKDIKTVILFSRFSWYLDTKGFKNSYGISERKDLYHFVEGNNEPISKQVNAKIETMKSFVDILNHDIRIIFIEPIPEMGWEIPKQKISSLIYETPMRGIERTDFDRTTLDRFDSIKQYFNYENNIIFVKTDDIFCDDTNCFGEDSQNLLYYDSNHPSEHASELIVKRVIDNF